jgi:hypothetical protein
MIRLAMLVHTVVRDGSDEPYSEALLSELRTDEMIDQLPSEES